jgi:hypothetical protein
MSIARRRRWCLALAVVVTAPAAAAVDIEDARLRLGVEFAEMVSRRQTEGGFTHGLHLRGGADLAVTPRIELQAGWSHWLFPRAGRGAGALSGPFGALRVNLFTPENMALSAEVSAGPQFTGEDLGVGGDVGVSFEYAVAPWLMLGVTARGGATFSTMSPETAYYCSLGGSVSLRLPPADMDHDNIPDSLDACPDNSRGQYEDPLLRGCPRDTDGDGVYDEYEGPPSGPTMISSSPRVVSTVNPVTPLSPVQAGPDVDTRPGPSATVTPLSNLGPDQDSDGYPDQHDSCADLPETFNGVDDEDGCPDGRQLARVDGRTVWLGVSIRLQNDGPNTRDQETVRVLNALATLLWARCEPRALIDVGDADAAVADARSASLARYLREHAPRGASPGCPGQGPVQYESTRSANSGAAGDVRVTLP